jgi:hypothetical protein
LRHAIVSPLRGLPDISIRVPAPLLLGSRSTRPSILFHPHLRLNPLKVAKRIRDGGYVTSTIADYIFEEVA